MTENPDGTPLDVGRKTRSIPTALRRALNTRDKGCRFPACTNRRFTDAHHIDHWANGGETKLQNLVLLCGVHHRLVHEEGFSVEQTSRGLVFKTPDGRRVEDVPAGRVFKHDPVLALMALNVIFKRVQGRWETGVRSVLDIGGSVQQCVRLHSGSPTINNTYALYV